MDRNNRNAGIWVYRFLVLVAVGLVIYSFTRPWWICDFMDGHFIKIYGWGLSQNLKALVSYVKQDATPRWQIVLAWVYVGISCLLALLSTWVKRLSGALFLGLIGIGFIAYPTVSIYVVISHRIADFGIALQGFSTVGATVSVYSHLTHLYYFTYAGGALLIILALIRGLSKYLPFSRKLSGSLNKENEPTS